MNDNLQSDAFDKAENIGRYALELANKTHNIFSSIQFTKDKYYAIGYMKNDNTLYIIEIKNRNFEMDKYNTAIIESNKLQSLLKVKNNSNKKIKILYFASYSDGTFSIWNMENYIGKDSIIASNTTMGTDTYKISKSMLHYSFNDVIISGNAVPRFYPYEMITL